MQTLQLRDADCEFIRKLLTPELIQQAFRHTVDEETDEAFVYHYDGTTLLLPKGAMTDKQAVHALQTLATMVGKPVLEAVGELAQVQHHVKIPVFTDEGIKKLLEQREQGAKIN